MSEQHGQTTAGNKWGDQISAERKAELQGYLDRWKTETMGSRILQGPFSAPGRGIGEERQIRLTGADAFWLAEQSGRDRDGAVPRLKLTYADLGFANLAGANLSRADLSGISFYHADLSHANLAGARLSNAHLSGANLSLANLTGANLFGAGLGSADLGGADLSRANLTWARLIGADLGSADLTKAKVTGANFTRANVYKATGIRLFSIRAVAQLVAITLGSALGLILWVLLDVATHWTTLLPWLSASIGMLLTAGAMVLLLEPVMNLSKDG